MAPRGTHDLLARGFLGRRTLEVGLAPAGHGVANVGVIVDREVLAALPIDVGELAPAQLLAVALSKGGHVSTSLSDLQPPTHRDPDPLHRSRSGCGALSVRLRSACEIHGTSWMGPPPPATIGDEGSRHE